MNQNIIYINFINNNMYILNVLYKYELFRRKNTLINYYKRKIAKVTSMTRSACKL